MLAAAVVATETTTSATMVTASAATITIIETTLFATLTLILTFGTRAELRAAIFATVVAAITTTTTSTAMVLAATISAAVATFVPTTFAGGALVLALDGSGLGLFGGASEEAFQPAEKAGFFGFGDGWRGFRLERALFALLFAELLATFAGIFATGLAGAKLVAGFLRLFAAGGAIIAAC